MIEATINLDNLTESEYKRIIETLDEMIEKTELGSYEIEYESEY